MSKEDGDTFTVEMHQARVCSSNARKSCPRIEGTEMPDAELWGYSPAMSDACGIGTGFMVALRDGTRFATTIAVCKSREWITLFPDDELFGEEFAEGIDVRVSDIVAFGKIVDFKDDE